MRMLLVVAASLLALAGCEGTDEPEPSPTATPTTTTSAAPTTTAPANESLGATCPRLRLAIDAAFEGERVTEEARYQRLVESLTLLITQVDPEGEAVLNDLLEATKDSVQIRRSGASASRIREVDQDWSAALQRVADACQRLGSPLS